MSVSRSSHRISAGSLALPAMFCLLAGCCNVPRPRPAYYGPTEPMAKVVSAINANNLGVRSLYMTSSFDGELLDDKKRSHTINGGDAVIVYRKPNELLIRGSMIDPVFELGSNREEYWMNVIPETNTQWWGRYRNLGKPCSRPIPVRPDLMLEVLGVGDFDTNFNQPPVPIMRFDNDADAYVFVWAGHAPDRWFALKEIWYDRRTKLPAKVALYDVNGRVVLRAALSDHQHINDDPRQPMVASGYELFFPDSGSSLAFHVRQIFDQKRGVPNDNTFLRRAPEDMKQIQLDEECGD